MPTRGLNLVQQIMKLSRYDMSISIQSIPGHKFASMMRRKWQQVNQERYSSNPCADCVTEREESTDHMLFK